MSLRFERALRRRRTEILITAVLFLLALSLVLLSLSQSNLGQPSKFIQLGDKMAFAIIVALVVRWVGVCFAEFESTEDSDSIEYHDAIKNAKDRIWICQTWLPGTERDSTDIFNSQALEKRILLASFKDGSPIFARIAGRRIKVERAKGNVESSVKPFVENGKKDCLRFNFGHHPGWIAVIDASVFWGPTPVDRDNHTIDFLFHKHRITGPKGAFWLNQFKTLWESHSHGYDVEKSYNDDLRNLEEQVIAHNTDKSR